MALLGSICWLTPLTSQAQTGGGPGGQTAVITDGVLTLIGQCGDLNKDGRVDVLDLVRLKNHLNGTKPLSPDLQALADLDQDGRVTQTDARILEGIILQRDVRAGEDFDRDGLSNADELRLGANPFDPDTDHDGWPDGFELAAETNPLDPKSVPQVTIVASPPVEILSPLGEAPTNPPPVIIVATPPVEVSLPSAVLDEQPGIVVAYPLVEVLAPASAEAESGGGIIVAYPLVEVLSPLGQETEANLTSGGVIVAVPGLEILMPLGEEPPWPRELGPVLAQPPVEVNGPP